jgi:hypothetical protein
MDLIKLRDRTFDVSDSVPLFRAALGFDRIIGDASRNFFAVAYSNNRRVSYMTLTNALEETKFQVDQVLDVSDAGVLGRMITKEREHVDPELGPIGCWNPRTGERLWIVEDKRADAATWLKGCALVGNQIRDAVSGRVIATVPANRIVIASKNRLLWTLSTGADQKFEVWRVR